jgi:hypothetical protein
MLREPQAAADSLRGSRFRILMVTQQLTGIVVEASLAVEAYPGTFARTTGYTQLHPCLTMVRSPAPAGAGADLNKLIKMDPFLHTVALQLEQVRIETAVCSLLSSTWVDAASAEAGA